MTGGQRLRLTLVAAGTAFLLVAASNSVLGTYFDVQPPWAVFAPWLGALGIALVAIGLLIRQPDGKG
jgi:hypothetical protein